MIARILATLAAAALAALVACGGSLADVGDAQVVETADAGCDAEPVDVWCSALARGGVNVDPRAASCCPRWLDEVVRP